MIGTNFIQQFFNVCEGLVYGGTNAVHWIFTPVNIPGVGSFSPIAVLSFSGLFVYLGIAIVKWLAS